VEKALADIVEVLLEQEKITGDKLREILSEEAA
jgi:ATP-dependent Zn protease